MSEHATKLRAGDSRKDIRATLCDELSLDDLFDAEAVWSPARIRMVQEFTRRNLDSSSWPQSLHWNWAKKAAELMPARTGALGDIRLIGIKCRREWQGVMLAKSAGYTTRSGKAGMELVYIEYLESAPWNWEEPRIEPKARYRGVGPQLIEMAVRWSKQLGFRGRIGLHALEQAAAFYRQRCGMSDLGPDMRYHGMRYFELSETLACAFLEEDL